MEVRDARAEDLPRLLEIYNHYVEHTAITFDTTPVACEARRAWLDSFADHGAHRLLVSVRGHEVLGYASSGVFRVKPAYSRSVETSIYLDPREVGRGVGSALYARLLETLVEEDSVHRAYGGVALPNEASVALHQRLGFKRVGTFSEVGFKFGRYWDVAWFERTL